ncbi:ceramide synthase 5 isoform X2 [Diceros bicornis minor]|uniref:ceramide synthase 5 isoform X2 n=1 Tax=Diceros bicornis minor TaxID=77932 RepID=UPI0026ED4519|nr:ceramide synthase 5 isoform X2 [Diceros bicornis minor]
MATAVAGALGLLWGWLWSERFWLPQNVSWADLEGPADGSGYPRARHILSVFPLAAGIFFVRRLFERFIAKPCARHVGILDSGPYQTQPNAILEKVFISITKSPWFWDTRQCWHSYPYQSLTSGLYYYYIMELAFYWSLMFSQFTDIKRKDFLIMFVHHLATIGLITFSYINNMVRVGTLVMCLHDASDFLLEAAKLANYAKYQRLCDTLFVIFGAVFVATRLGIYPFWVLNTTLFESWEMIGPYASWWLFNGLLLILQVLHVIWSYLIVRIAFKALIRGKVSKDDRSDVESSSEEEDVTTSTKSPCSSNSSNGANRVNGHMGGSYWAEE